MHYEDVRFNVINVTRGWAGVKFPEKKHLNGPIGQHLWYYNQPSSSNLHNVIVAINANLPEVDKGDGDDKNDETHTDGHDKYNLSDIVSVELTARVTCNHTTYCDNYTAAKPY